MADVASTVQQAASHVAGAAQQAVSSMQQPASARQHSEGTVAWAIEQQTAKLPSDLFLWAAVASIGGSLLLHAMDKKVESNFVGQWAPTFLLLGLYNKIVKVAGSDRTEYGM